MDIKRCRYIYIKVTKTRVLVVYPLWMYINRYDRLAVQFCLRVNRLNLCYAWYSHIWGRISGQFRPFEFRIYTATVWDYTPPLPVLFEYISLSIFYLYIHVLTFMQFFHIDMFSFVERIKEIRKFKRKIRFVCLMWIKKVCCIRASEASVFNTHVFEPENKNISTINVERSKILLALYM